MAHEIGLPFLRPLPSLGGNHCFFEQFDAIRIAAYQHSPMDLPNIPDPFVLLRLVSPFCHFLSNHLTDGRWGGRIDDQVNGHSLGHVIHMQTTGLTALPHFFAKAIQQRLSNLRYHLQNCHRPLHLNLNHLHPHLLAWEPIGCLLEQICLLPLVKVDVSHSVASAASRDLHQNVLEELSGLRVLMEENLHLSRLRLHLQGMQTFVQIPCASFCCCGSGWWRRSPFAHGWHCPPCAMNGRVISQGNIANIFGKGFSLVLPATTQRKQHDMRRHLGEVILKKSKTSTAWLTTNPFIHSLTRNMSWGSSSSFPFLSTTSQKESLTKSWTKKGGKIGF